MASPKPKRRPKQKKDASEKPQSERFKETARKLGATSKERFEKAFEFIVRHKPKPLRSEGSKKIGDLPE